MADDRGERLIAEMRRTRGYVYPEWELIARQDPDFMEAYDGLYQKALGTDAHLPVKYRELVALGILAFRGAGTDALVNHVRRAMAHGATRAEVLGALEATIVPGGAPTFVAGVRALLALDRPDGR
jgi:alkylhydroperoxidase/carboxymuconolactone decarboxylase family protein YurZ